MKQNLPYRGDWFAAGLLVAAIFTASVRLNTTVWTPDLVYVEALAVTGTLLGLALGISHFRPAVVRWLVSAYTMLFIPGQLSHIITGEKTALGQLASLAGRLAASLVLLLNGKAIEDYIFFVTLMCILFWAIGVYSGYRLMRRPGVFPVLLPSTLPLLIIQYYDGFKAERIWGLALYFFLALLLTGRMNLLKSRERWDEQHVLAGSDPEFDLNKNMAIAAAVIILAAWMLPAPAAVLPMVARAWRSFSEPFENTRQRINDMLAALDGQSTSNLPTELYGKVMGLGRIAGSGDDELFRVHAPLNNLPRLYWRVRAYDQYSNGSWQTSNSQNMPFDPDQGDLLRTESMPAPGGEFVFSWQTNQSAMLVTPSQPVWASRTGSIQIANDQGSANDPLGWNVTSALHAGDQYQMRATLLNPTRKTLRSSAAKYPDWVTKRYLQVPENISADLKRLAEQITAGKPTTYDKVEAVTEYLRQNITYAETIPTPSPGVDAIIWFLLDWKSGFCNYYASAEVLLLRSLGIPARLVVGYAQGKTSNYADYSVRGQDAHAWPEVYFSDIGWLEFEPTVNQQELVRPSGENLAGAGSNPEPDPLDGLPIKPGGGHEAVDPTDVSAAPQATFLGLTRDLWLWVIISLSTLALTGIFAWRLQRRQSFSQRLPRAVQAVYTRAHVKSPPWLENWLRWSEASSIERYYHAINQALTWLGKPQPAHVTPAERAELLKSLIPAASADIQALTAALEKALYTPQAADPASAARHSWNIRFFTIRKLTLGRFYGD